jgi:hypothetical protein
LLSSRPLGINVITAYGGIVYPFNRIGPTRRATIDRPFLTPGAYVAPPAPVSAQPPPDASTHNRAGFLKVVLAVWSSFFGVRKRRDHDAIAQSVKPQHLIVAGLLGALIFVLVLIGIVRVILANAT